MSSRIDVTLRRPTRLLAVLLLLLLAPSAAQAQTFEPLWPEGEMPNTRGLVLEDSVANQRIYRVGMPGMWAFLPAQEEHTGSAVVILPGGGYHHLTYNLGGFQLAKWFNTIGVSAFVVKYRLPTSPDLVERSIGPLQDAQRAVRLVRSRADEWSIDPERVGVMGRSAGGHLAATLGTHSGDVAAIGDALDEESLAPAFMILVSPVIDLGRYAHEGSRSNLLGDDAAPERVEAFSAQTRVTAETPPAVLFHATNDTAVPPMNSVLFYQALLEHDVSASLHVFPQGGHAIGVTNNPGSTSLWMELCEAWLDEMGFLPAP